MSNQCKACLTTLLRNKCSDTKLLPTVNVWSSLSPALGDCMNGKKNKKKCQMEHTGNGKAVEHHTCLFL